MVSEALSAHISGVAVLLSEAEHLYVEALHHHGTNIASFNLLSSSQWWYILGCYLDPENALTIEDVVVAIIQWPCRSAFMVTGNLNANLAASEGHAWDEVITSALSTAGLEEMGAHCLLRHKPWLRDGRTWIMLCRGQDVQSRSNYILGIYCRMLQNVALLDSRNTVDHFLVLGCLRGSMPAAHTRYLGKWKCFPLKLAQTTCLQSSGRPFQIHPGGNGPDRNISPLRPGIS